MTTTRFLDLLTGFDPSIHRYLLLLSYQAFGENEIDYFSNYQPTKDVEANAMLNYLSHVITCERCQILRIFLRVLIIRELTSYIQTGEYDKELVKRIFYSDMSLRGDTVGMKQIDYFLIMEDA